MGMIAGCQMAAEDDSMTRSQVALKPPGCPLFLVSADDWGATPGLHLLHSDPSWA